MKGREPRMFREDYDRRGADYERRFEEPKYMNSRIVVGNIGDKAVPREILDDRFNKYGRILGISQHRGYAYVQFDSEEAVATAIKSENDTLFLGGRLDVRAAKDSRRDEKPRFSSPPRRRSPPKRDFTRESYYRQPQRDRSPLRSGNEFEESFRKNIDRTSNERLRSNLSPKRDSHVSMGSEERFGNPAYQQRPDSQPKLRDSVGNYVEPVKPSKSNDCEIILLDKSLRPYADLVDWKLKEFDMKVGLLFLKENTPVIRILEELSFKGCLFGLVIMPQNETHKSVTVNILFGTPQEHRNMPLADAVLLIKRSLESYKRERASRKESLVEPVGSRPKSNTTGTVSSGSSAGAGMSELKFLFNLLADDKQLTVPELDRVINYLQDYRTQLSIAEGGPAHSIPSSNVMSDKFVEPLDGRGAASGHPRLPNILNELRSSDRSLKPLSDGGDGENYQGRQGGLMNNDWRGAGRPIDTLGDGRSAVSPGAGPGAGFINFDNPSIKRALDSLLQSGPNLLRTLEAASGTLNVPARPAVGGGGGGGSGDTSGYPNVMPYRSPPLQPNAGNMHGGGSGGGMGVGNLGPQFPNQSAYQRTFYN